MTTVHITPPKEPELSVIARAIGAATEIVGWEPSTAPEQADWTICLEVPDVVANLQAGRRVLHVGPGPGDHRLTYLAKQHPALYRFASSIGYDGEPSVVQALIDLAGEGLSRQGADVQPPLGGESASATPEPPRSQRESVLSESFDFLSRSPIRGLRIMVVDDKSNNLLSAKIQFGESNIVTTFNCYEDVCKALSAGAPPPDLLLSDMLMPTEKFCLGDKASASFLGMEIPVGIFLAFIAARAEVPRIVIQTDAGHHDHPALALIDFMGWGRDFSLEKSQVQIVQAHTCEGIKDWGLGLLPI